MGARRIAFSGLLTALAVLLIALAGILEINTLFLLVLAAYLMGTVCERCGIAAAAAATIASVLLALLLAPIRIYSVTFLFLTVYVLLEVMLLYASVPAVRSWLCKALCYQALLVVGALLYLFLILGWSPGSVSIASAAADALDALTLPEIFAGLPRWPLLLLLILLLEAFWLLLDRAYLGFAAYIRRLWPPGD